MQSSHDFGRFEARTWPLPVASLHGASLKESWLIYVDMFFYSKRYAAQKGYMSAAVVAAMGSDMLENV